MKSYESFTPREAEYFAPLLPLVRAERKRRLFGHYYSVSALYEDQVVQGRCAYLESVHEGPLDAHSLASRLSRAKVVQIDASSRVRFSPGNRRHRVAKFRIDGSKRMTLKIPNHEIEHPLAFLKAVLGERLVVKNRVGLNSIGLLVFGLPFLALMIMCLIFGGDAVYAAIPAGILAATLLGVFAYDQLAVAPPWVRAEKKKKALKDLSGRQPFRWHLFGQILKLSCGAVLLISLVAGQSRLLGGAGILLWPVNVLSLLGLYYGHLLSQRKAEYVRAGDPRPPILYLRSFLDDRKQTLVANTRWAAGAGILPPSMFRAPWNYILALNPVRIVRVLINRCVDTSEEQIGLFMRKLGPFVAIGQPGETFAAPGAARMYVTNEEWKGVVDSYLIESKYIVMQPANTEGVWWEVERVLQKVPLQKILFCMVNFHLHQNDYEAFLVRIQHLVAQPIPLAGGLTTTPAFLYFDSAETPRLVPTSYSNPFFWPYFGNAVDLPTTLQTFLEPETVQQIPAYPRRPNGMTDASHFVANCVFICVLVLAPSLPFFALLIPAVQSARQSANKAEREKHAVTSATPGKQGEQHTPPMTGDPPATPPVPSELQTLLKQSDELFAKPDLPAIEEITGRMIALAPQNALVRAHRGFYLKRAEKPAEALKEFEKSTELEPKDPTYWSLLGQEQIVLKQFPEAEASFSQAIALKPDQASFHYNRGFACFEEKKYEPAAVEFARAVELKISQRAEACVKCGLSLQRSGKVVESLPYFNSAEQLEPTNVEFKMYRARAFEALGNRVFKDGNASEFARAGFDDVLKLAPESAPARFGRAMALQRLGKHTEAIPDFDAVLKIEPNNDVIIWRRGYSHLLAGHYSAACADLELASRLDPKDASAPELIIRARVAQGNLSDALTVCDQRLEAIPDKLELIVSKTVILFLMDRTNEANLIRDAVTPKLLELSNSNLPISGMMLALQSDQNPDLIKQAIATAEQRTAANPNVPMPGLLAVALRIRLKDYEGADTALRAIDGTKLSEMSLAFHRLCQAVIAAQSANERDPSPDTAAAVVWFEQNCPIKFEEDHPDTLSGDWTTRSMLGRFYREMKPAIAR